MPAIEAKPKDSSAATRSGVTSIRTSPATKLPLSKSSSSSPSSSSSLQDDHVQQRLYQGIPVMKICSNGRVAPRTLTLTHDHWAILMTHGKVHRNNNMQQNQIQNQNNPSSIVTLSAMEVVKQLPIPFWTPTKGFRMTNGSLKNQTGSGDSYYTRFLDVADIDSIVEGVPCTRLAESIKLKVVAHESLVTIFHHGFSRTLHFMIANPQLRKDVVHLLRKLLYTHRNTSRRMTMMISRQIPPCESVLRYLWYHVDTDRNHTMSAKEIHNVALILNLSSYDELLPKDKGAPECSYSELVQRLWNLQAAEWKRNKKEDRTIPFWNELTQGQPTNDIVEVNAQLLQQRLKGHQYSWPDITLSETQIMLQQLLAYAQGVTMIASHPKSMTLPSPTTPISISQYHWHSYLVSEQNSAYDPAALEIPANDANYFDDDQYFDRPLSEYWINTSHNTYLTGDQVQSKSSVEAYWWALERGCKCLELDCWDGNNSTSTSGRNNYQAVVYHGHTLTSKIFFVDVLKLVHHYIVHQNPDTFPIILSLENHCSFPFQEQMAKDLKTVFGNLLYVPPLPHIIPKQDGSDGPLLPSPNQLKGKIVIKGKRPPEPEDHAESIIASTSVEVDHVDEVERDKEEEEEEEEDPYDDALMVATDTSNSPRSLLFNKGTKIPKEPKISPALARLTLFHGCKFKNFDKSLAQDTSHMHSIGETKLSKMLSHPETPKLWRQYNQTHMTRTYPAGFRVDSSNYNPILAWAMGCQLVALNFQTTNCIYMSLNDGRFRQAGGLGYVLKPPCVLESRPPRRRTLELRILQGYALPKPSGFQTGEVIDPYVRVELHDVKVQENENGGGIESFASETLTTNVVSNNGFCPVFDDNANRTIFNVHNGDVAMLHFQVLDNDLGMDDKIATAAIPVNQLRQGYRSVPLYGSDHRSNQRSGLFRYASLLVCIRFLDDDEWNNP